ncbi:MAG TPA: SDR family oxidoreductase [Xanthobacteraceae bacterium]|jgi:short-subunit dehydrogenase|nr:SDR family oxidoreductase [Xanthobacteraceae bacterium]
MATTVVITGASAGIGRAVALEFARTGCNIALMARGVERLESAARQVRQFGVEALPIPVDVADGDAVDAAAARVETALGPIDVWVNNAMAAIFAPVHAIRSDEFRRVTEVNYLGQVHGTLAALRRMRRRNQGTIVQIGSAMSYRAMPLQSACCAAKFAVRGFTDALRLELAHERSRIRITMVQLPAVNTPQFDWARRRMAEKARPAPPIFQPEAIAPEIVRAAREAPRELWIGHSTAKAIVGAMLLPDLGENFLPWQDNGEQFAEPRASTHADNLFSPPPGDPGTRGRFDNLACGKAVAFEPAWLRAGGLFLILGSIAGAFVAGAFVLGQLINEARNKAVAEPFARRRARGQATSNLDYPRPDPARRQTRRREA